MSLISDRNRPNPQDRSTQSYIRGWAGETESGWVWWREIERVSSQRWLITFIRTQAVLYVISSISDRNKHNPQDRLRQSLPAGWYNTHPY